MIQYMMELQIHMNIISGVVIVCMMFISTIHAMAHHVQWHIIRYRLIGFAI